MTHLLYVALGGALGAVMRYGVGLLVVRLWGRPMPYATWVVNLLGCLLIGLLVPLLEHARLPDRMQFVLVVGFLGAFTTFSTFSFETVALWDGGQWELALLNVVGSVVLGVAFVWLGLRLGTLLLR